MAHSIAEEITEAVNDLPPELQTKVLAYVRNLGLNRKSDSEHTELLSLVGTISNEDAEAMLQAIEEECERVDLSEW